MDYSFLGDLAKAVVERTMQKGEKTHPANDFMERTLNHHCVHAVDHLDNAESDIAEEILYNSPFDLEEVRRELEHAMTRIAIMLAKLEGMG